MASIWGGLGNATALMAIFSALRVARTTPLSHTPESSLPLPVL